MTVADTPHPLASRNCLPSCLRSPLNTTVRVGMLTPMAKVSVANSTCGAGRGMVSDENVSFDET